MWRVTSARMASDLRAPRPLSDADALYASWSSSGVKGRFIPPHDTPYGLREFAFVDRERNRAPCGDPPCRSNDVWSLEPASKQRKRPCCPAGDSRKPHPNEHLGNVGRNGGRSCTDAGSPKLRTANARILDSIRHGTSIIFLPVAADPRERGQGHGLSHSTCSPIRSHCLPLYRSASTSAGGLGSSDGARLRRSVSPHRAATGRLDATPGVRRSAVRLTPASGETEVLFDDLTSLLVVGVRAQPRIALLGKHRLENAQTNGPSWAHHASRRR